MYKFKPKKVLQQKIFLESDGELKVDSRDISPFGGIAGGYRSTLQG